MVNHLTQNVHYTTTEIMYENSLSEQLNKIVKGEVEDEEVEKTQPV